MSYNIIVSAWVIFVFLFFCQIVIAAVYRPTSEDKFIITLFTVFPAAIFLIGLVFHFFSLVPVTDGILIYCLYFAISSSWVASYPAVYAVCPTLIISYVIDRNQKRGTDLEELRELLGLKLNSTQRIDDAVHDKFIVKIGDKVHLTGIGRGMLWFFKTYRRVLGLNLETL